MAENDNLNEKKLFEWEAYERPHKVWSKEFYSSVVVIAFLVSVILFFIEGLMPVFVVWALVFMMWAMGRTEPKLLKSELTSWGLRSGGRIYEYGRMTSFWMETKWGSRLLRMNLVDAPWHIVSVILPKDEDKIKEIVSQVVQYREPEETWMDRWVKWFGEKMPLE